MYNTRILRGTFTPEDFNNLLIIIYLRITLSLYGRADHVGDDGDEGDDGHGLAVVGSPGAHVEVYIGELEDGAHHTHEGAAGDEAGSDEGTLLHTGRIDGGVGGTGAHEPGDGTAYQQGQVKLQGISPACIL